MTNFQEILNEITEQETAINNLIAEKQQDISVKSEEITELQEQIASLTTQLSGLTELKTNAEALQSSIAANTHTIDFNLNVNASGGDSTTVFSSSTPV